MVISSYAVLLTDKMDGSGRSHRGHTDNPLSTLGFEPLLALIQSSKQLPQYLHQVCLLSLVSVCSAEVHLQAEAKHMCTCPECIVCNTASYLTEGQGFLLEHWYQYPNSPTFWPYQRATLSPIQIYKSLLETKHH